MNPRYWFSPLAILSLMPWSDAGQAQDLTGLQNALIALADKVRPAVVLVTTEREVTALSESTQAAGWRSSASAAKARQRQPEGRKLIRRTVASGFVLDEDGHIVTLARALNLPAKILVKPLNRPETEARLLGVDEYSNIAILEAKGKDLVPAPLGDSASLRIGQWVASVANPFGLEGSVSTGTVSGLNRYLESASACYLGLVQITNPINPGETGGALVDLDGRVVGMLCSSYADSVHGNTNGANVNFAIPADRILRSAREILATGKVAYGWLGVTVAAPKDGSLGAVVVAVSPDSPARKAELEAGDLIVGFGNHKILRPRHLQALILASAPNTSEELAVARGQEVLKKSVQLTEIPQDHALTVSNRPRGWLGAGLRELTPEYRLSCGLEEPAGVLIGETVSGSPVTLADIRAGDVVVEISGRKVLDLRDCLSSLSDCGPGEELELLVFRSGDYLSRRVRLAPPPPGSIVNEGEPVGKDLLPAPQETLERELTRLRKELEAMREDLERLQKGKESGQAPSPDN